MNKLSFLDKLNFLLGTWFGSGLLPKAPGTWGTLAAIPLVGAMLWFLTPTNYLLATVVITMVAMPIATRVAELYRSVPEIARLNPHKKKVFKNKNLQKHIKGQEDQQKDPGMIVIDEVAGYAASLLFVRPSITALVVAFFLFRFFDIIKLQPGKFMESLGGGTGIVLDDIVAGLYACLGTHLFFYLYNLLQIPMVLP